jgi:hypothetical protein
MKIGRIMSVQGYNLSGEAEFVQEARLGDYIYYTDSQKKKVMCQITKLRSAAMKGLYGHFKILDVAPELPSCYTDLLAAHVNLDRGPIEIGTDIRNKTVKLAVNPFFWHVLIAGRTGEGKTHTQLVLEEEFLKQQIPSLVLDLQGEMTRLGEFSSKVVIAEQMAFEDLLGHLKLRKTVVCNLQGLTKTVKAKRAFNLLSQLMSAKETDYKRAESDVRLLENPPLLISIDEVEILAPQSNRTVLDIQCRDMLIELTKRGAKYGIGVIASSQQITEVADAFRSQCGSVIAFNCDETSRRKLKLFPYVSRLEIDRISNLTRGQCIMAGKLIEYPAMVQVRDIASQRAKNLDFSGVLGIKPNKEVEIEQPEKAQVQVLQRGAGVDIVALCPDCKKPLEYDAKVRRLICKNSKCEVIGIKAGKVIRSSIRTN